MLIHVFLAGGQVPAAADGAGDAGRGQEVAGEHRFSGNLCIPIINGASGSFIHIQLLASNITLGTFYS